MENTLYSFEYFHKSYSVARKYDSLNKVFHEFFYTI